MHLLAIETCFQETSVCLYKEGIFFELTNNTPKSQASLLPVLTEELLTTHKTKVQNLNAVIVNHGPGAFTGMRVGIAFALGLTAATNVPLFGVSSMQCFVCKPFEKQTTIALKGLKNHAYVQTFSPNGIEENAPLHIPIEEISTTNPLITVGFEVPNQANHFKEMPTAKQLIERFLFKKPQPFTNPLYVRTINATVSKKMKKIL